MFLRLPGTSKIGAVDLIVGRVVGIHIKDEFIDAEGKLDMEKIRPIARMGYSDYTVVEKVVTIPHIAHALEMPMDRSKMHAGFEGQPGFFEK